MIERYNFIFENVDIAEVNKEFIISTLKDNFSNDLDNLVNKYPNAFKTIIKNGLSKFLAIYNTCNKDNVFDKFKMAYKYYIRKFRIMGAHRNEEDNELIFDVTDVVSDFDFNYIARFKKIDDIKEYDENTVYLDSDVMYFLDTFGIDNILKFEDEYHFFTHNGSLTGMMHILGDYEIYNDLELNYDDSYESFQNNLALVIDKARGMKCFSYRYDEAEEYVNLGGRFRVNHPELFIKIDDNDEYKRMLDDDFYAGNIYANEVKVFSKLQKYLKDKNLGNVITKNNYDVVYFDEKHKMGVKRNLFGVYSSLFGNEKTFELINMYGDYLEGLKDIIIKEDYSKEKVDDVILNSMYNRILDKPLLHCFGLKTTPFYNKYPDLFLETHNEFSSNEDKSLKMQFEEREINIDILNDNPSFANLLIDKNLKYCMSQYYSKEFLDKIKYLGNERFIKLCKKYGEYIDVIVFIDNDLLQNESYEFVDELICNTIIQKILDCSRTYDDDAPSIIKEKCPEIFLGDDVPKSIKVDFYAGLSFDEFTKDRYKYMKDKNILPSLAKTFNVTHLKKYFELFGYDDAVKNGILKPNTVSSMIYSEEEEKMYTWYLKTGKKFIPHHNIMRLVPEEDIDKFLSNATKWSKLVSGRYSKKDEYVDAMLKAAYAFGVFDGDDKGFNQLLELTTLIPFNLDKSYKYMFQEQDGIFFKNHFVKKFKEAGINIEDKDKLLSSLYKENSDGSYTLIFDPQRNKKAAYIVRLLLEEIDDVAFIRPNLAHSIFGDFKLLYDKEFKEFFINNFKEEDYNPEYYRNIGNIQRRFAEIKTFNSNRKLTVNLALDYIKSNSYDNVEFSNTYLADLSSDAGYSQADFDLLQQIYDYGKRRTYSSIPRIDGKQDKYTYEILRLTDPLTIMVGVLTNCCQKLGDAAESCMIHSMTSEDGRVFVIKDDEGNIVAQSWVWRNGNTICFDNIEIPENAFKRSKNNLSEIVYNIYEKAANELISKDNEMFLSMLENGQITKEQYENLKLAKVTVGLGYNDIANKIKSKAYEDSDIVSPVRYKNPFDNSKYLYTSDSKSQYVIKQNDDYKKSTDSIMHPFYDDFKIYTNNNITLKELNYISIFETNTKPSGKVVIDTNKIDDDDIIGCILRQYNLDGKNGKILINPNFIIIYEGNDNIIKLADIFYNGELKINNKYIDITDDVLEQIKLALKQIINGKEVDLSYIKDDAKNIYENIVNEGKRYYEK